jgi:hAT family C-terminal dimerisation region
MDLLVWWSQNCTVYPKFAVLARRLLACQATNASSERAFSRSGAIATKTRNRLTPKTLNMLTFLRDNFDLTKKVMAQ